MSDTIEPVAGQHTSRKPWRPFKFQSLTELQAKIDAYFADCDPHPIEVIEYKWHQIEEKYEEIEKGETVQKTRTVNDYTQMPETLTRLKISNQEPYSITGLALALDTTRKTILSYEKGEYLKDPNDDEYDEEENQLMLDFINTIKKAKTKIEHDVQRRLEGNSVAGTIFNLKNNFDWIDRQETDGTQEIIVTTRKHRKNKDNGSR
jgi:hypothetical protein